MKLWHTILCIFVKLGNNVKELFVKCTPIYIDYWGTNQYNIQRNCSPKEELQWQYNIVRYRNCLEAALT